MFPQSQWELFLNTYYEDKKDIRNGTATTTVKKDWIITFLQT